MTRAWAPLNAHYRALHRHVTERLTHKQRRHIMSLLSKPTTTEDTFLPAYGLTAGTFALFYIASKRKAPHSSTQAEN